MDNNSRIQELKSRLNEELKKSISDNDLIISLSQEIASLDSERVRFSVDAGLINRLGTELVGKKETAVSELVKNAYDADATLVKLIFENSNEEGGILQIEDNGSGMSRNELINGFMKISSTEKVRNPLSPKYNRNRAGRKGIGRFAVQRLADELIILTKKRGTEHAYRLTIDWSNILEIKTFCRYQIVLKKYQVRV